MVGQRVSLLAGTWCAPEVVDYGLPAEPKEDQAVEVSICESPHSPDGWIAAGSGVAAYEAER